VQDDRRVVVIGSGPPGGTAALFLAKAGIDVTMLEAGAERASLGLTVRVKGLTLANLHKRLRKRTEGVTLTAASAEVYEELSPGGLTNHWSCAVPRFSPEDFRDAQRAGEEYTWPIGYDDLAPWYDEVEPLLHVSGGTADHPQVPAGKVRDVWRLSEDWASVAGEARGRGRSILPIPYTYGSETTVTLSGTVFNSYVRLVKPALKTGHLAVRFGAHAQRLEYAPDRKRVVAVHYRDLRTGVEERIPCAAVVVAAGAVNTARLLLESTSDLYPDGLGNTDGVLGRYLHDHPVDKMIIDLTRPMSVHPPAYISRTSLERSEPLYAAAGAQWTGTAIRARSMLFGGPQQRLPWIGFNVFGTMPPNREHGVKIDRNKRNPDGSSAFQLHIRHPDGSDKVLTRTRDEIVDLLTSAGVGPSIRVWKVEPPGSSVHFGGSCRMHASPRFGMLDGWSRMHRVPNVVVADSAAFTTGPEKNPVVTAMALSARASDRLARDLRAGAF
jgi:choline dehydrogenase-like flavoprotein